MSQKYAPSSSKFTEDPNRYHKNGLHPLIIGDTLNQGQYRIVHKLGSGSFATVWLARDTLHNAYVSLKVLSADLPTECKELRILQQVTDAQVNHPGREFVIRLRDSFVIDGVNGKHLCLVTGVAGERLQRPDHLAHGDLEWPRGIGLQIAQGLGYLHTLGIAHADCYTSNILSQLQPFDDWTEDELYACMGQPVTNQVRRLDGKPKDNSAPDYTVDPGNVLALQNRLHTGRILLIDLGAAFYHDECPPVVYTPAPLTSPEILFGGQITYAIDKWAFGCLLYELCADRTLIKLLFGWNNDAKKDQVAMLGKPPDALWQNWEEREEYFYHDGTPKEGQGRRLKVDTLSLKQRVRNVGRPLSERDDSMVTTPLPQALQDLYDLLQGVLIYDAGARLSFEAILAHPFFGGPRTSPA
ncbi:hypothetical protein MY11210_007030 [Beauveria gryllotalpidicola]